MSGALNVAVLKGGRSLERQVSLASGDRVEEALARLGHAPTGIDVGPDLVPRLAELSPDLVFIALHGRDGEDGSLQELLETLDLPYTGSSPAACARAWDKQVTKELLEAEGIGTPRALSFSETALREFGGSQALARVGEKLGFPVVVKPCRQGSALGVRFASGADELPEALLSAFSYSDRALIEEFIPGRELAVPVFRGLALPVVEARPTEDRFYDFEARYTIGSAVLSCPAELDEETSAKARETAERTVELLGLRSFARVDMLLDERDGVPKVLEADAIPGLTDTSLLPQSIEAAGIGFDEFVGQAVEEALAAA